MSELFPKDIDAIARAAFETHLPGQFWDEKGEDVKSKWRDQVEPAIAGRNQTGGIPAIEAGIVKAWESHIATVKIRVPVMTRPAPFETDPEAPFPPVPFGAPNPKIVATMADKSEKHANIKKK
jgi:hypothetical protein